MASTIKVVGQASVQPASASANNSESGTMNLSLSRSYQEVEGGSAYVNGTDNNPFVLSNGNVGLIQFLSIRSIDGASFKILITTAAGTDQAIRSSDLLVIHAPQAGDQILTIKLVGTGMVEFKMAGVPTGALPPVNPPPFTDPNASYLLKTPNANLPNSEPLSTLGGGLLKVAATTGVVSAAIPDVDYATPGGSAGIVKLDSMTTLEAYAGTSLDARTADVRDEFYADPTSNLTVNAKTILTRSGGGRWLRKCLSDAYWQAQTELWVSPASGNDRDTSAIGHPIQTIGEWWRRFSGDQVVTPATLYTDANLSGSESDLFSFLQLRSPRPWQLVSGSAPASGLPKFLFLANNIDGSNNSTLTDGQSLASTTWVNLGSASGGNALPSGSGMTYRAVASAGKLRNSPSVAFNGNGFFQTGAVAGLVSPITWVMIVRVNTSSGACAFVDGRTGGTRNQFYMLSGGWELYGGAGSGLPGEVGAATPNLYHFVSVSFIPHAAVAAVNGAIADGNFDAGVCTMVDGVTIGAGADGSSKLVGEVVAMIGMDTAANDGNMSMWNDYAQFHYGKGFPQ